MKNTNKFSIVFALFVMVFATFGLAGEVKAGIIYGDNYGNVTYEYDPVIPNPRPSIFSVNPNPITVGSGATTITVVGDNFVNGAVVKINNSDRSTKFISKTRVSAELPASDLSRVGDKVITVYNPGPGGGLSNGIILSIIRPSSASVSTGTVAGTSTSAKSTKKVVKPAGEVLGDEDCVPEDESAEDASDLAAGVIVGDGGFFPGSLVGWLILTVLILLLVILIRRMFGLEKKYHDSPLKHA